MRRTDDQNGLRFVAMLFAALVLVMLLATAAFGAEPDWQGVGFASGAGIFTLGLWAFARLYRNRW